MKHPLKYEESAHRPFAESDVLHVDHVPLSSDADNALERRADGLYAADEPMTVITDGVTIGGDGSESAPLHAKLSERADNALKADDAGGLYVEDCCETARPATMCLVGWEMDDAGFQYLTDSVVIDPSVPKMPSIRMAFKIIPGTSGPWTVHHAEPGMPTMAGGGYVAIIAEGSDISEIIAQSNIHYGVIRPSGQIVTQSTLPIFISEEEGRPICVIIDEFVILSASLTDSRNRIVYIHYDPLSGEAFLNRFRIDLWAQSDNGHFQSYPLYWPTEALCSHGDDAVPSGDYPGMSIILPPPDVYLVGIHQDQPTHYTGGEVIELRCWIMPPPEFDPLDIAFTLSGTEQDQAQYTLSAQVPIGESLVQVSLQTDVDGLDVGQLRIRIAASAQVAPASGASGTSYFDAVINR